MANKHEDMHYAIQNREGVGVRPRTPTRAKLMCEKNCCDTAHAYESQISASVFNIRIWPKNKKRLPIQQDCDMEQHLRGNKDRMEAFKRVLEDSRVQHRKVQHRTYFPEERIEVELL